MYLCTCICNSGPVQRCELFLEETNAPVSIWGQLYVNRMSWFMGWHCLVKTNETLRFVVSWMTVLNGPRVGRRMPVLEISWSLDMPGPS
jgi:hypothetical protein